MEKKYSRRETRRKKKKKCKGQAFASSRNTGETAKIQRSRRKTKD